jgi:hypothetical protein
MVVKLKAESLHRKIYTLEDKNRNVILDIIR